MKARYFHGMAFEEDIVRVSGHRLEGSTAGAAAMAALVLTLVATRTEMGARILDLLLPVVSAQEPPKNAGETKSEAPKDAAAGKKEGAEEEGDPKFPPVLSWKVKVKLKNEITIYLTRTEDGKKTHVEIEGAKEGGQFDLGDRLPVDTSEKERKALCLVTSKALCSFFKKGDIKKGAESLESGKYPMTAEPKTIDWEVVAEKKSEFTVGFVERNRFVSNGDSTIVIVSDEEGGYVVRVQHELPRDIDPSNEKDAIVLRRILFGGSALIGPRKEDTFEARIAQGEGEIDKPGFEPRYRIVKHAPKEVSTKAADIKKP